MNITEHEGLVIVAREVELAVSIWGCDFRIVYAGGCECKIELYSWLPVSRRWVLHNLKIAWRDVLSADRLRSFTQHLIEPALVEIRRHQEEDRTTRPRP